MERGSKLGILIFIVLIIISLGFAGITFNSLQKEQQMNAALQQELEKAKNKEQAITLKLDESRKMISALEGKLAENRDEIESLTKGLEQEKTEKEETLAQMEQLKADLEKEAKLRSELQDKFLQAQEYSKKMRVKLDELAAKKEELESKIKDWEEKSKSVELGKIVVTPEAPIVTTSAIEVTATPEKPEQPVKLTSLQTNKPAVSGVEGKVLVVNKDYNFFVMNLGGKDGVSVGSEFSVYHNDKYVGDAKVEKVHDTMASAGFPSEIKQLINEGDKVVRKN